MDYDLGRLGDRQFEHLAQALAIHYLGPQVSIFGSGPDGGREATWQGVLSNPLIPNDLWSGYGVLQAKYKLRAGEPKENADWLTASIYKELDEWAKPDTKRQPVPDIYLIATNVVLSAAAGGGIDTVIEKFKERAIKLKLKIKTFAIWHHDQFRVLLDGASDIRTSYAAWITPGDVLAALIESNKQHLTDIRGTLYSHIAKTLLDDVTLNLTQAGTVGDKPIGIADVFIDLPAEIPSLYDRDLGNEEIISGIANELVAVADRKQEQNDNSNRVNRIVLVGGPGQGKSTVGQFLCQVYRANFLMGTHTAVIPDVSDVIENMQVHSDRINLRTPSARRWPFSIKLTALADALAKQKQGSLLEYIAEEVSERSGSTIDVPDMKRWLADYPWFVVLDGFDEVPASSNRDQVLTVIRDFLVDAATVTADVVVVATTRPQGYNDDFDPRRYRHYNLTDLNVDDALKYAYRLLELRLGVESPRLRSVFDRLETASREEATARLLSTPLQTTILTLLVERLGQAPKDRWRLFSQYYKVVYQREQEKGGPLAEILHDYESHIHAIHRETGFMLQQRGEQAGDTTSFLTADGLIRVIAQRLIVSGYEPAEAAQLAQRFREVFTDRLVFLTELRHDVFGFEIRSLQEFMAGEAVVQQMESKSSSSFRQIAASSYWRNTVLFAVGKIFAERDHLCGEVVALCSDLNLDNKLNRLVKPGSDLALSILVEGVARTHPAYARPLAACACLSLTNATPTIERLAELDQVGMTEPLDSAISVAIKGALPSQVAAVLVIARRVERGTQKAVALATAINQADDVTLRNLIKIAWFDGDPFILPLVSSRILLESPLLLARDKGDSDEKPGTLDISLNIPENVIPRLPNWLISLRKIAGYDSATGRSLVSLSVNIGNLQLRSSTMSISNTGQNRDWLALSRLTNVDGPWAAIKAVATFATDPTVQSLAVALEQCSLHFKEMGWLVSRSPWPLVACFEAAAWYDIDQFTDASAIDDEYNYVSQRLLQLSSAASSGELGGLEDWTAAELRWREGLRPDDFRFIGPVGVHSGFKQNLPISPDLKERGGPPFYAWSGIEIVRHVQPDLNYGIDVINEMMAVYNSLPVGIAKSHWARLVIFVGSVLGRREGRAHNQAISALPLNNQYFAGMLSIIDPTDAVGVLNSASTLIWTDSLVEDALSFPEIRLHLSKLGRCRRLAYLGYQTLAILPSIIPSETEITWPIARIALHNYERAFYYGNEVPDDDVDQLGMRQRSKEFRKMISAPGEQSDLRGFVKNLLAPIKPSDYLTWMPYDSVNLRLAALHMTRLDLASALEWADFVEITLDECPEMGLEMVRTLAQIVANTKAFPQNQH